MDGMAIVSSSGSNCQWLGNVTLHAAIITVSTWQQLTYQKAILHREKRLIPEYTTRVVYFCLKDTETTFASSYEMMLVGADETLGRLIWLKDERGPTVRRVLNSLTLNRSLVDKRLF